MQPSPRAGRRPDPRTDLAAIDAVLTLIDSGATLSGLSLVTIAEHVGVSRNSLYRRWKTKDDLYLDVLAAINTPLPEPRGESARQDMTEQLAVLAERSRDSRASNLVRALQAEETLFPDLYQRYYDEIVTPRREAMYRIISRGISTGEIRPDIDIKLVNDVLVAPILARGPRGGDEQPPPSQVSRAIVDLVFAGIGR